MNNLSFEESIKLIEEKLSLLETGSLSLSESVNLFKEISSLLLYAKKLLLSFNGEIKVYIDSLKDFDNFEDFQNYNE